MKTKSFKTLPLSAFLISATLLSGCYPAIEDEGESSDGNKLNVITRSVSGNTINYPLTIYAFDSKGNLKGEKTVTDGSEMVGLTLTNGDYRVTAVSGTDGVNMPKKGSPSAQISTRYNNYSSSPISMGHADIYISGTSAVTIQLSLMVSSVEITLCGLPDDVSNVSVNINKVFSKVSLDGEFSDETIARLPCMKQDDGWTTGKVYLLPSAVESSVFSFVITDSSGTNTYGYTYNARLKAGVPYILRGEFTTGFQMTGTVVSAGWDDEVILDFNFGPGVEESGGMPEDGGEENPSPGTSGSETVSSLPSAGSIWNGHVVALVENETSTSADIVLISLNEWKDILGDEEGKKKAREEAVIYSEDGMSDWVIPDEKTALSLIDTYAGDNISDINDLLESIGKQPFYISTKSGNNHRYLCDNADKSFSMGGSQRISPAGESTKYRLRLVKRVHVKI